MFLGQSHEIFDWFIIHFTENNGMAFGLEFGGDFGKLFLTLFRIIVVAFGGWYLVNLSKKNAPSGLLICSGLILGGALGNIIDSVFYGVIFSDSYRAVAEFLPAEGGYASFFYGKVVDMFYFPLINTHLPNWLPFFGGDHFIFFRPVFNIADASISISIICLLLFYRRFF